MNLLFGIHCHQPFNNFYEIVKEATEKSYLPFLKYVENFKNIKINVHYSGWLFNWLKENSKETFNLLKKLHDNNQIEFFTSGYYEPILSILPEKDAELQIIKSNKFIKDNFGVEPQGLWLTERVWEDKLIKVVVNCGIKYVVVDDYHFFSAGIDEKSIHGYYLTESEGNTLGIFPINKHLRYIIPFKEIDEIKSYLNKISTGIIFDDGEKFGLWPKTYEWVYEKGWLNDFFTLLNEDSQIITLKFKDFFEKEKPLGRIYLPEVSYFEMGEWALDYQAGKNVEHAKNKHKIPEKYLRTGIWKNFLRKYEESNNIHKRMLYISKKILRKNLNHSVTNFLLQSQCNDCLWHGVFGGIYLPILRNNAYISINNAEKILDKKLKNKTQKEIIDYNCDGYNELILKNQDFTIIASSKYGGQVFDFSDKNSGFNLFNTLARRKELYHDKIFEKEENQQKKNKISTIHEIDYKISEELKQDLIFDKYLKYSFIDKFFSKFETFASYKKGNIVDIGNFSNSSFDLDNSSNFSKNGFLKFFENKFPLKLSKNYNLNKNTLLANITVENNSFLPLDLVYCIELNFFFPGHNKEESYFKINNKTYKIETELYNYEIKKLEIFDSVINKNITITSNSIFKLWSYPFYSISKSEKGFDKIYQGSSIGLLFPLNLFSNDTAYYNIKISLECIN